MGYYTVVDCDNKYDGILKTLEPVHSANVNLAWLELLITSTGYTNPISLEDIASLAYISLSHLHRMFTRVFGCSLKEYMTKRSCVVPPILTSPSAFRRRNRFSELYLKIVLEPNTLKDLW